MNGIKTSLYEEHYKLGAKIVPFAGYLMPVSYSGGLAEEYNAVRTKVGIFDVSHMGQLSVTGIDAIHFLNHLTVTNVDKIQDGGAQYSMFCNDNGTVIDDIIIYRNNEESFFIIVNASNIEKDYNWLLKFSGKVDLENLSNQYSILAVQGPLSRDLLVRNLDVDLTKMAFYTFKTFKLFDEDVIISRTGYTGELGYEIIGSHLAIKQIWKILIKRHFITACGLAVRDILRIEMKYCLYGNDLSDDINPIQAGLKWVVDLSKEHFIGKKCIEQEIKHPSRRLVCFKMLERSIPRKDYEVYLNDNLIGVVSSGTFSIGLNSGIGLAFIDAKYTKSKTIDIKIRNKFYRASLIKPPFINNYSLHS